MRIKGLWTAALTVWLVPVMSAVLSGGLAAQTPGPRMGLAGLEKLAASASETVDVSLDTSLLALAARFMDDSDTDDAQVKAMMSGLKGIYVRSFEFGNGKGYTTDDVATIRKQLNAPGWARMVNVDKPKAGEVVDVYFYQEAGKVAGLAVLVAEPAELTVVNIVGPIDLSKLPALGGQFGIPNLPPVDTAGAKK